MALITLDVLFPTGAIEEILRKSWLSSCISAWKGRCHLGISGVAGLMIWLYFPNGNSTLRPGTWGIYGECLFIFFQRFLKEIQDVPYAQEFFVHLRKMMISHRIWGMKQHWQWSVSSRNNQFLVANGSHPGGLPCPRKRWNKHMTAQVWEGLSGPAGPGHSWTHGLRKSCFFSLGYWVYAHCWAVLMWIATPKLLKLSGPKSFVHDPIGETS